MPNLLRGMSFVFIMVGIITSIILGVPLIISYAKHQDYLSIVFILIGVAIVAAMFRLQSYIDDLSRG